MSDTKMAYLLYIICTFVLITSGTFLICKGHYAWAWFPFLLAACLGFKNSDK